MAALTTAAFLSKWNARFADNTTRDISEEDMREFVEDIKDSFQNITGAVPVTSWKSPCAVATTGNITLSGEQTLDGVLTSASRVLVKNQTTQSQNGIYVSAAGAWSRSNDADDAAELEGAAVGVTQGTTQQNTVWLQTSDNVTLGSTAIAWQQIGFGFSSGGVSGLSTDKIPKASSATSLADSIITESSSKIGVSTSSPDRKFHVEQDSATTNAVTYVQRLTSTSSGTPANGIGVGIEFEVETSAGNNEVGATIEAVTTDVTGASEDFNIVMKAMAAGAAATTVATLNNSGLGIGTTLPTTQKVVNIQKAGNVSLEVHVNNTNGTSSADSILQLSTHSSGGDPVLLLDVGGGDSGAGWMVGVDNSDNNILKFAASAAGLSNATYLFNVDGLSVYGQTNSTNAVNNSLIVRHQSTGTPANGIGVGIAMQIETSNNNYETGATIEAVTTDVTSTSEDIDLVFKTMAAGATAAEAVRIKSDKSTTFSGPAVLPSYTVAGVPSASSYTGGMIYVSNETGGAVPAFSDGTNWRRVTDRNIIS